MDLKGLSHRSILGFAGKVEEERAHEHAGR
jgi:hypothetical protein